MPAINREFAAYELRIRRSRIEGWGVYAAQTIPRGRKVIEYSGERLTVREANRRLRKTCRNPRTRKLTMFKLGRYWRIDGAVGGSGAERINHSCKPNLKVRKVRGHLLLFSLRRIRLHEELTLDYKLSPKTFRIRCRCGSSNCRGTINRAV
jgi:uncharacterized protein